MKTSILLAIALMSGCTITATAGHPMFPDEPPSVTAYDLTPGPPRPDLAYGAMTYCPTRVGDVMCLDGVRAIMKPGGRVCALRGGQPVDLKGGVSTLADIDGDGVPDGTFLCTPSASEIFFPGVDVEQGERVSLVPVNPDHKAGLFKATRRYDYGGYSFGSAFAGQLVPLI